MQAAKNRAHGHGTVQTTISMHLKAFTKSKSLGNNEGITFKLGLALHFVEIEAMKSFAALFAATLFAIVIAMAVPGCTTPPSKQDLEAFQPVQAVLETNCVHCHGDNRLSSMPSIHDSNALAKLVGTGKWIVPGRPEQSRFFQVVTFPDQVPGAMPPTGHAITSSETVILREWILEGASVPKGSNIIFTPRGKMPRSE